MRSPRASSVDAVSLEASARFPASRCALFLRVVIDSVAKTVKTQPDEFQGLIVGVLVVLAVTLNEFRGKTGATRRLLPGGLGIVTWLNLTLLSGVLSAVIVSSYKLAIGSITATVVGLSLGTLAIWERSGKRSG